MSKAPSLPPGASKKTPDHSRGDVGYGRPPREHRFKPGQSGNPRGRPKGRKNEATILREHLYRKITLRTGARVRKAPVIEGIILKLIEDALRGSIKSADFIFKRLERLATAAGEPERQGLTEDDRTILEAYKQRVLAAQAKKENE